VRREDELRKPCHTWRKPEDVALSAAIKDAFAIAKQFGVASKGAPVTDRRQSKKSTG